MENCEQKAETGKVLVELVTDAAGAGDDGDDRDPLKARLPRLCVSFDLRRTRRRNRHLEPPRSMEGNGSTKTDRRFAPKQASFHRGVAPGLSLQELAARRAVHPDGHASRSQKRALASWRLPTGRGDREQSTEGAGSISTYHRP